MRDDIDIEEMKDMMFNGMVRKKTKKRYTIIYTDRWMQGSHMQSMVRFKRVFIYDNELLMETLDSVYGIDSPDYIFMGWSKLEGESDADYNTNTEKEENNRTMVNL